ncbi:hypothetical protein L202_06082 [Cryptococcus amylolentus CBS 6039]|uniref:Uncharacterized protein n=1 Tax=Cryptococcus amylolentus CBS 6039 TaxID=1295533 RepID=A0A1E3HIJ7_9TREE|nr:hypothetical protein L202_06082 [Cryptococcus amylolentus CBS 6039]ODN76163.1 hypothetical protein L202_06082 [Cryptococcus amylolentus CBS 6039]
MSTNDPLPWDQGAYLQHAEVRNNMEDLADNEVSERDEIRSLVPKGAVGANAYRIKIPSSIKIHPVFHIAYLELYNPPAQGKSPNQQFEPYQTVIADKEWEVACILDSKVTQKRNTMDWEPSAHLVNASPRFRPQKSLKLSHPTASASNSSDKNNNSVETMAKDDLSTEIDIDGWEEKEVEAGVRQMTRMSLCLLKNVDYQV